MHFNYWQNHHLKIFIAVLSVFLSISSAKMDGAEFRAETGEFSALKEKDRVGVLTRTNFEDSLLSLYNSIGLKDYNLDYSVFLYGMTGYYNLQQEGKLSDKNLVSIIDFTKSSSKKRFYTIDLEKKEVLFHTYVSHGRNTGSDIATSFSNASGSFQSSLGFYITAETYTGSKGFSLRLDGTEKGYNDNMRDRAVVMHDAEYVSESWIKKYGRLGRSQGCPALPKGIAKKVIETIKEGTPIFAYYKDENYLNNSNYLNKNRLFNQLEIAGL